jgi:hypothetical protein
MNATTKLDFQGHLAELFPDRHTEIQTIGAEQKENSAR